MIHTVLTHGLTVILSFLCLLILSFIVGQIIRIIWWILNGIFVNLQKPNFVFPVLYPPGSKTFGDMPTLLIVNRLLPINLAQFLISLSSNILYLPLILFLYQYIIDCIYVFDIIFMYSLILLHILKVVTVFFKGGTIKAISSGEWIEQKSTAIGEIIGIIISFYFFGGKLAEAMCFSSI